MTGTCSLDRTPFATSELQQISKLLADLRAKRQPLEPRLPYPEGNPWAAAFTLIDRLNEPCMLRELVDALGLQSKLDASSRQLLAKFILEFREHLGENRRTLTALAYAVPKALHLALEIRPSDAELIAQLNDEGKPRKERCDLAVKILAAAVQPYSRAVQIAAQEVLYKLNW